MEHQLVAAPDDIFTLKKGDLLNLPRFAEKSADNLIKAIEKSKKVTLPRFLAALSIPQVGEESSYDIARHFEATQKDLLSKAISENVEKLDTLTSRSSQHSSINSIMRASKEDFESIYGVGPVVAESASSWFKDSGNR